MIHIRHGIDQPDLFDAFIRHARVILVDGCHLAQDLLGRVRNPIWQSCSASKPELEPGRQIAEDLPIRARHAAGRLSRPHPLDAAVGVGERPILFGERSRGQEDIRKRAELVDEQILRRRGIRDASCACASR